MYADIKGEAVVGEVGLVLVEGAGGGAAFDGHAVGVDAEGAVAFGANEDGGVPSGEGLYGGLVVVGAGTFEGDEVADAGAHHKDAFVAAVDGDVASHVVEVVEFGKGEVDDEAFAEGDAAVVVFPATGEQEGECEGEQAILEPRSVCHNRHR